MPFIKENKIILPSVTKFASKYEILAEVEGYRHASKTGLKTAKLLHWSENAISVEHITGISCFRYLQLLDDNDQEKKKAILNILISDVLKFQSSGFEKMIIFSPYPVKEKAEEILDVMNRVRHPFRKILSKKLSYIQNTYINYATVPFRDANPKNTLLNNVSEDNFSYKSNSDLINAIRHIDFRSVSELTTNYDDIISILYHYQISEDIRSVLINDYGLNTNNEEFLVTLFVRMGRFWSRRIYYLLENKALFNTRYKFENLDFYSRQFNQIIDRIIRMF